MITPRFALSLLFASLLGLGGCVTKPPVPFYQLDSGSARLPRQDDGPAVLLGPVQVADYLNQDAVLQRNADGSLTPLKDARWANRLPDNIDHVLLNQLAWRLGSQNLALAPAPGFSQQLQVQLVINRLDSGPEQPAVLEAQWRLLDRRGQLRDSRVVRLEVPHQGSVSDQVRAQSLVLQRFAGQLADAIAPLAKQIASSARKASAASRAEAQEEAPKIPVVEPVRSKVEVFRF
jgi:hypothetical protein